MNDFSQHSLSAGKTLSRLAVILNPNAGRRRPARFQATLEALRALGGTIDLHETRGPGDAQELAGRLRDADAVVAAGGDGTVNEIVNGLMAGPASGRPPLAILPLGTANVLAREIGLRPDPARLARTILHGDIRAVALGRAGARYFTVMAGIGFDAHVVANVSKPLKQRIGKGAYVWEALRQLGRFAFPRYRVTVDGRVHEAASVIVAKGRHYAGPYVCAPEARLTDPLFQVCLFTRPGARNALRYAAALGLGRLPRLPDFRILPGREVDIEGPVDDPVQGDGDVIGRLPLSVRVAPAALRLVMPPAA